MAGAAIHGWRKSSRCDTSACVEVARVPGGVAVRDGKDREGAVLIFRVEWWQSFVDGLKVASSLQRDVSL
ncbi:DUF397 domain-containing protein [Actinomycetes bacterium KLBMP 9797]